MPVFTHTATAAPEDIVASLSLVAGTKYTLQNIDPNSALRIREAAVAPDVADPAFRVVPNEYGYFSFEAGEKIFAWAEPSGSGVPTCTFIVTETV